MGQLALSVLSAVSGRVSGEVVAQPEQRKTCSRLI